MINSSINGYGLRVGIDVDSIVNGAVVKVRWNDRTETCILLTDTWEIVRQRGTLIEYKVTGFDLNDMRQRQIRLQDITEYVCGPRDVLESLRNLRSAT